jgi:anti-sigma factor RsiW
MSAGEQHPLPTCREVFDHLSDWAEGRIPEADAEGYRRHLELCPPCGSLARTYQSLARVARSALEVKMPEEARHRLWQLLQSRFRGPN